MCVDEGRSRLDMSLAGVRRVLRLVGRQMLLLPVLLIRVMVPLLLLLMVHVRVRGYAMGSLRHVIALRVL